MSRNRLAPTTPGDDEPRVTMERIEQHTDARGTVFEPIGPSRLAAQRNAHVALTEPGEIRGNHVHRHATEILVVRGPAQVRYQVAGDTHDVDVDAGDVVSFTVPPGVPHAVVNTGSQLGLLVAFRDSVHDPDHADTDPVELV